MPLFDTDHWRELGKTYAADFPADNPAYHHQRAALVGLLKENVDPAKVNSIFEVGCGFGRITEDLRVLFPDARIVATDVSEDMLRAAEKHLVDSTNPPPAKGGVALGTWDLDTDAPTYLVDMVVAAEVLMHRRPARIAEDVTMLCAMAQRFVVMVDWYEPDKADTEGNYQHPYEKLVHDAGEVQGRIFNGIMRSIPEARQAVWLFEADRPITNVAASTADLTQATAT